MTVIIDELRALVSTLSNATWRRLTLYFVMYLLPVVLFAALAIEVREANTPWVDTAVLEAVHGYASPTNDRIATLVTNFGDVIWVGLATVLLIVWLWRKKRYRDVLVTAVGIGGSAVINVVLKAVFQRDRPQLWQRIITENGHSFPSGHAMASASLALVVMLLLWPTRWRWWAVGGAVTYAMAIGLSRLYLGVHYPSDVIAGWLVAGVWVLVTAAVIRHWRFRRS